MRLSRRASFLVVAALGLGISATPAAAGCITDLQGADDVPGQKDLSKLCELGPTCSAPNALSLSWQFDDTSWTGGNTGDACALIDTNRDGLADRAVCVTVFGSGQMAGKCSNNALLGTAILDDQDDVVSVVLLNRALGQRAPPAA